MNNISVDIRLRPIRFGFLVRPDDQEKILEIFRINTCLWGGLFNPIIPFFQQVPSWWDRSGFRFESAKQIINGYLDFFEPDFLVEAEEGIADGFGFDSERVLQLTDILERPGQGSWDKYGLSIDDLYSELYREEFRFEPRYQRKMIHVESEESVFAGFVAANFGSFPNQEGLRDFERSYKDIFSPDYKLLDATMCADLYQPRYSSALGIGCEKLRIDYRNYGERVLFMLDAKKSRDLVDFWNLRTIHEHVVPVPIQWLEELSPFCNQLILGDYHYGQSYPNRPGQKYTLMFGRSISVNQIEEIGRNHLGVNKEDFNTLPTEYPSIWGKPSEWGRTITRPILEAYRKSIDVQVDGDNPEIRFDPLFPEFAREYGNRHRVANVIRLQDWSNTGQIATVFPYNYKNPTLPKFGEVWQHLLPTTEGLVIFPEYKNLSEQWNLTDGTAAFNQWFKAQKVAATFSHEGRVTQQIIQILGGSGSVGCLAHKNVIELLNKMSNRSDKSLHHKQFQSKIHNAVNSEMLKDRVFETLVKQKAVELGLELKCNRCSEWSWYSANQLDYSLTCTFCFRQFDFPILAPTDKKHIKWAYRVVGPFALPRYADGGYAAALAIRFFANVIRRAGRRSAVTWSSCQQLSLPTGNEIEADFMLWHRRAKNFETDYPTEAVFGEAKSFGKRDEAVFDQDKVDRMKLLAEAFPGSILVFATMREGTDFSKEDIDRIKELAEWGREYDSERRHTRAPVVVLTGTELFTERSFEKSWEDKGGTHKRLIRLWEANDNLKVLANLTQQLYLEMPPYDLYLLDEIRRRERHRERPTQ